MKTIKNLLLTFDFELFLGANSGSVENCLIRPTEELMKIVKKHKVSTVFFVDTLYMSRLKEVAKNNTFAANDYTKIVTLLQAVIDFGGYVFHHLHPHWIDAIYLEESNEWDVSNKNKFALNNLSKEEIEEVFQQSEEIISEIYLGKNKPIFSGFRAGGLYAQPFNGFKNQMSKHNIKLDFSVLKNAKSSGDNGAYGFDYSVFPSENIFSIARLAFWKLRSEARNASKLLSSRFISKVFMIFANCSEIISRLAKRFPFSSTKNFKAFQTILL